LDFWAALSLSRMFYSRNIELANNWIIPQRLHILYAGIIARSANDKANEKMENIFLNILPSPLIEIYRYLLTKYYHNELIM
jgi:hypothetical protein